MQLLTALTSKSTYHVHYVQAEMRGNLQSFPISLVGFPTEAKGEVETSDGKLLGRWFLSELDQVTCFSFVPQGEENILFQEHFAGVLLEKILTWHQTSA